MKILVYGDTSPASGGWCYTESLREMGHEVLAVPDEVGLEHYRSSKLNRLKRRLTGGIDETSRLHHTSLLIAKTGAFRPQIVLILKGLHISRFDLIELRKYGCWVCNVNHDDFFSANQNNWSVHQRGAIPHYDYLFTTREVNVEEVSRLNPNVEFFPFAFYPQIHRPVYVSPGNVEKWACDVVFVGTYERHRAQMLENLVRSSSFKLVIHGGLWGRLPFWSPLRKCLGHSDLRFDELSMAIGCASVALGFLRKDNRDDYTQRTFEIPACGGVFLAERTDRHLSYYKEGAEAEFFDPGSVSELGEKIARLLREPERRELIRNAGRAALLRGKHTYKDRLERLLEVYHLRRSAR
jgi:spore maturation protein CgeB